MVADTPAGEARIAVRPADYAVLTAEHPAPCISIYLRSAAAESVQQRLLRLENMLRAAETRLRDFSMSWNEAESLLSFLWRAIEGGQTHHPAAQSLVMFLSKDSVSYRYLAEPLGDRVMVGREFFVRPLLSLLPHDDRFFVLTLSQKHVKLYEGSASGIKERALQGIPENVRDDFEGHRFEREYQLHTASPHALGEKGAVFHGPSLDQKDKIRHFLRDIDRGVAGALKAQQAPLIVAAVDYLIPIYRSVNTYAHLADDALIGSPDLWSPNELYSAAWKTVEKSIVKQEQSAFALYQEHINTPLTSSNLREVVTAAQRGHIRFLFLSASAQRWGLVVSPETVHVHNTEEPGDSDLLNLAAILTLRHGGQVFEEAPNRLPEGAEAAAVFRFQLPTQGVT